MLKRTPKYCVQLFVAALSLFAKPNLPCASEVARIKGDGVRVLYENSLDAAAREVLGLYPVIRQELEQRFLWKVSFETTIVLMMDNKEFQRVSGSNIVVAFAVPHKNLIVIDMTKMTIYPFSLETTMKHELCHLLLHWHIPKDVMPRWVDEGVAQWTSDGISEIMMDRKRSRLEKAILGGRAIHIDPLRQGFPSGKEELFLAYEVSKSLVEHIVREWGHEGLLSLLNYLKQGEDIEGALGHAFSISMENLRRDWLKELDKKITWFTYLSIHLYEILFFLGALVTIFGFVKILLKKRAYRREEESIDQPH